MALLRKIIPFTKQHPWKTCLLLLLLIFLATVLITSIRDFIARKQVATSIDKLYSTLTQSNFTRINKNVGCGRTQEKYGEGTKLCSYGLNVQVSANGEQEADERLVDFKDAINRIPDFTPSRNGDELPDHVRRKSGSLITLSGARSYRHKSGYKCIASYSYKKDEALIDLRFNCDTTSWLTRNLNI
jgi:hypothetical protein